MKLATPVFYRDHKFEKFMKQWDQRLGLEVIKMQQAIAYKPYDAEQRKAFKREIQQYLDKVVASQQEDSMKDVYITDHKAKIKKFITFSEEEDEHYYQYMQSLNHYKATAPVVKQK